MNLHRQDLAAAGSTGGRSCMACPLRTRKAFKPKPDDELAFIEALKMQHRRMPAGSEIVHHGQADAELFTLFSGWAIRQKTLPDGRRQILNILLPGDLLGLQASLLDAAEHSIEALTDVELCVFPRRKVWHLFERMPQLAYELAWLGAREECMVDENLTSVGQRSARERMAALIIGLYRRCQQLEMVDEQGGFPFPLTRQHLADALGLSLVHTIKTWSHLRRTGMFRHANGVMTLLDLDRSERWARYAERELRPRPLL